MNEDRFVSKFNPTTLVLQILDRETREIKKEHKLVLGKKKLNSVSGLRFNNETACKLRRHGFWEYDDTMNNFIIRYELK